MIATEDKVVGFVVIILTIGLVMLFFLCIIIIVSAYRIMNYIRTGGVAQQSLDSMPI